MYFHATNRCQACLSIEEYTRKAITTFYEKQLKDSTLKFSSLDFLDAPNSHFQDEYKFESQTLIISKKVNNKEVKWKNLDKIWDYVSDFQKFQIYIKDEISQFLKDN